MLPSPPPPGYKSPPGIDGDGVHPEEFTDVSLRELADIAAMPDLPDDDRPVTVITKSLSRSFGNKGRRRAELIARLKRVRRYPRPVRGGTGKQRRSRPPSF